ncbi:MAG: SH3 domain-containing protein [Sulfitobacter sp.]
MKRFVFLSFGFLGWAFYEVTGGSDFDPIATRAAIVEARGGTVIAEPGQGNASDLAAQTPANEPVVTRVALNLTSLADVLEADAEPAVTPEPEPIRVVKTVLPANDTVETLVLPSLVAPIYEGSVAVSTLSQGATDIRSVTGNAVNVRSGPGTSYDAVSTLRLGDQVEILQDTGSGWVEFRRMDTGTIGWVADFLLTDG